MSQILRKSGRHQSSKYQEVCGRRERDTDSRCSFGNRDILLAALKAWETRQGIPQHVSGYERDPSKKTAPVIPT